MPKNKFLSFFFLLFLSLLNISPTTLHGNTANEFPVLYKGRFRPAEAYARLWLYDLYHSQTIKRSDFPLFRMETPSSLDFLWKLDLIGHSAFLEAPLFSIRSAEIKQWAHLPLKKERFAYLDLRDAVVEPTDLPGKRKNDWSKLLNSLNEFKQLEGSPSRIESSFRDRFSQLKNEGAASKEIGRILEREYPIRQRLQQSGALFKSLPSRYQEGEWLPLNALIAYMYDPSTNSLKPVGNFTLYSDNQFESIREAYLNLENDLSPASKERLSSALLQAFQSIAGKTYKEAHGKKLAYPTIGQLKMEALYVSFPWVPLLIMIYGAGALMLLSSYYLKNRVIHFAAISLFSFAVLFHTALLAMRCYILGRAPVSNMFETVLYVPWVAACASLLIPLFRRQPIVLFAASLASIILLLILEATDLNQGLDQVQAVLDSQFWLLIHVLLVVGSYGIFILGAILGHFYLGGYMIYRRETQTMALLTKMILQTMYGGTALLVAGTILGGIWAAQSWGRFWDWDPKESWAFISSSVYLIWIHCYRFHRIASFGLAFGAVSGFLAISFTWYGVNYILGTGLHSYGFGSGGEGYYYTFIAIECLFLAVSLKIFFQSSEINFLKK